MPAISGAARERAYQSISRLAQENPRGPGAVPVKNEGFPAIPGEGIDVRFGSRLCENSVTQLACRRSVSISLIRKSIVLTTSVARR